MICIPISVPNYEWLVEEVQTKTSFDDVLRLAEQSLRHAAQAFRQNVLKNMRE